MEAMTVADAPASKRSAVDLRFPWRPVVLATTGIGALSGLRIYLTYNAVGVRVSLADGLASGLLDWWLWIPLAPVAFYLARRFEPSRARPLPVLGLHLVAGVLAALVQISLFSAASGAIRALRFDEGFRFSVASPLFHLAPAIVTYWIFVVACWWHGSRQQLTEGGTHGPRAAAKGLVAFRAGRRDLLVRPDEVDWVAAAGNYLELHGDGFTHLVRETLKSAHGKLGSERFLRIHRSTLVRCAAIATVSDTRSSADVVLTDGTRLPVGRSFRGALEELRG